MRHPHVVLNLGAVRQLGGTLLQRWKGLAVIALLKQNPSQSVSYVRLVRCGLLRFLGELVPFIDQSELVGIDRREIVESQRSVWVYREHLFVGIAGRVKMLQARLDERE